MVIFFENQPDLCPYGYFFVPAENLDILIGKNTALTILLKISEFGPGPEIYRLAWVCALGKIWFAPHVHVHFPIGLTWGKNSFARSRKSLC